MNRRGHPDMKQRLNRHATTILIGGIFLFFSVLLYMSLCTMPCYNDGRPHSEHQHPSRAKKDDVEPKWPFWNQPRHTGGRSKVCFLVILIMTGPKYYERRDTMRQTWLSGLPKDVCPLFIIGTGNLSPEVKGTLDYEHSMHDDLLLMPNFNDSYTSLTEKLLQSLTWVDRNIDLHFLFKVDDDTFARMDVVLTELKKTKPERLYWGFFDGRARVKRKGKWAEHGWFLSDRYLPHALGGGYILSADLVHFISHNAPLLQHYNNEDISLGTWLSGLNINRVHDPRFDTEYKSRGCMNAFIVTHKQSSAQMKEKHKNLKETGNLCPKEVRVRLSYIYNWNVEPSLCCIRNDSKVP